MNIFILDSSLEKCAECHVDSHNKMILESAQMISTVLRSTGTDYGYRQFNKNHPCNKWAASSLSNFLWLKELGLELTAEMTYRYGTIHKSFEVIKNAPNPNIPDLGITPFAQAMPDEYKNVDAIKAYREFYKTEKFNKGIIKYTNRLPPDWLNMRFNVSIKKSNVVYTAIQRAERNEFE